MGDSNEAYYGESGGGEYEERDGDFNCKRCGEQLMHHGDGYCNDCWENFYEEERSR